MKITFVLKNNFSKVCKLLAFLLVFTCSLSPVFSAHISKNSISNNTYCDSTKASFTINSDTQCLRGNSFVFTNTSYTSLAGGDIHYSWSYNSVSSVTENVKTSLSKPGNYNVTLSIMDDNGCSDSITKSVVVIGLKFAISKFEVCFKENEFFFKDSSYLFGSVNSSVLWDFGDNISSGVRSYPEIVYGYKPIIFDDGRVGLKK
jgi:hypothetical protein